LLLSLWKRMRLGKQESDIWIWRPINFFPILQEKGLLYHKTLRKTKRTIFWPNFSLVKEGAVVCYGSDFPVVDINPLLGIYRAITRLHNDGEPQGGIPGKKSKEFALYQIIQSNRLSAVLWKRISEQ